MPILHAAAMSTTAYLADAGAEVQRQPKSGRAAPYTPSSTAKARRAAPAPLPGEASVPINPAHPAAEAENKALPPPPDKTTAPRNVEPSGDPKPLDQVDPRTGQPRTMTDAPVTLLPSERRDHADTGGRKAQGIPPAPPPRKTTRTPTNDRRAAPQPPASLPPPGPDTTRTPWSGGASGVR